MTGQSGTSLTIDASEADPATIATRTWRFIPDLSDPMTVNIQSSSASLTLLLPEVPASLRPNNANMVLRYSVTDQQGVLSSAQLSVTVTPSNQAPVVDSLTAANGLNVVEGESINLVAAVSDPDGDPIISKTWSVSSASSLDLSACDNQTSCQFSAPAVVSATDLVIRYQVTDIFNASSESTITLHISPNQAPQIIMPAAISVSEGQTFVLDGVRVSDDGPSDKLTYLWQVDSASAFMPSAASIVNPQQLKALLVAPRLPDNTPQVLTLRLNVSDHLNKSSSATLLVTVQAATAADAARIPQANAGPDLPSVGQLLAGSKIVLDGSATVDTQQQFDYEWYYAGAFDAKQNPIAMPSIDLLPDIGNIQKASFIAPLAGTEYFLAFNLRVSDNSVTPSLSSVDTLMLHISVATPLIDGVDASISVNNSALNSSTVTVIAGEPLHLQASNTHFVSAQQTVDVGTQDAAQYRYHWQSNDYPYYGFDAVNQAQVDFPPIATVTARSYQFVLQACDHYMLICSSKAFYLSVDQAGGFAGVDQIIEKPGRVVELQFTDNGRKTLDNNKADNRYETLHWQQISPQVPQLSLSGANSALATFNTAGVKKGDYVFKATYQVLDANDQPLGDALSDEVVISFINDVPAFKASPPQSKGGALDSYFSFLVLLLVLSRYRNNMCRARSRMRAALS